MNKHTQGRLSRHGTTIYFAKIAGGFDIRDCPCAEANARRIVACWNACQEISTDMLEVVSEHGLVRMAEMAKAYLDKQIPKEKP